MNKNVAKEFFSNTVNHRIERAPELANLPSFNLKIDNKTCNQISGSSFKHNLILSCLPFIFVMFVFGTTFFDNLKDNSDSDISQNFLLIIMIIGFLISIFLILYYYKIGTPKIIFNRENGTVTFPEGFKKRPKTYNFDDTVFYVGYGTAQLGARHLGIRVRGGKKGYIVASMTAENAGAFYTWYMDKNRPLPPGDRFDGYRKEDAKRLRDLGYPEPLYPMSKEVEELTREFYQQALNADISDTPVYNGAPGTEPIKITGLYIYRKPNDPGKGYPKLKPGER